MGQAEVITIRVKKVTLIIFNICSTLSCILETNRIEKCSLIFLLLKAPVAVTPLLKGLVADVKNFRCRYKAKESVTECECFVYFKQLFAFLLGVVMPECKTTSKTCMQIKFFSNSAERVLGVG